MFVFFFSSFGKKQKLKLHIQNHTRYKYNMDYKTLYEQSQKENEELKEEIKELYKINPAGLMKELKKENQELTRKSDVKSCLINELLSQTVKNMDVDNGIEIGAEYGHKYIDAWNKLYDDLIKEHIQIMNECEFDHGGPRLVFHSRDDIQMEWAADDED